MNSKLFVLTIYLLLLFLIAGCSVVTGSRVHTVSSITRDIPVNVPAESPASDESLEEPDSRITSLDGIQDKQNQLENTDPVVKSSSVIPQPPPTPTPSPAPLPQMPPYGLLSKGDPVSMRYFDDVLFVGDSITYSLEKFVNKQRASDSDYMGSAAFLAANSFGLNHALKPLGTEGAIHVTHQRKEWLIEDFIAEKGYKTIYLMLGMNDIGLNGIDRSVHNYARLIRRIRTKSPDVVVFIQGVTPMTKSGQKSRLNNANIRLFNDRMLDWATVNQCYFLDIFAALADEEGHLPRKYSTDNYIHLSSAAFPDWVDYLLTHTATPGFYR